MALQTRIGRPFQNCINLFEIEKSQSELNPKWTRLCDCCRPRSWRWRHFRWKCKDYRGLYALLNFEAVIISFGENKNQPFAQTTVGPLEIHFRGQGAKISNTTREKMKWSHWITVSKTITFFWIGLTVIEKKRPKINMFPAVRTGSKLWRYFPSKCIQIYIEDLRT